MNCNHCGKLMGASIHQDESKEVQAIHLCAHCGAKHVLSFERPASTERKPKNKVGHQVEWAFGYGRHIFTYTVIAQYRNWKGSTVYVLSEWQDFTRRFKEIEISDYAGLSQSISFSPSPMPMSDYAMALQRAYKAMNTLKAVNKSLRRVDGQGYHIHPYQVAIDTRGDSSKVYFDDGIGDIEYVWGNPKIKLQRLALRARLIALINTELSKAHAQASV